MAYSLPSVESMLKVLNYSYDEIIEDVYLCLTDNHIYAETGRSMWNCLVVIN